MAALRAVRADLTLHQSRSPLGAATWWIYSSPPRGLFLATNEDFDMATDSWPVNLAAEYLKLVA
jgi:hypothetical protein